MPEQLDAPFHEDYLDVGGGHALYFAEYGCADAPAVLVLHGGPGSGCHPSMTEWFDLRRWRVVLLDQRGAGRSRAAERLRNNTTMDLVDDIERLRNALGIRRWTVVGGSWGACLALLYAGSHPEALSALVLRGAFLAGQRDIDWFFQGLGSLVPRDWDRLTAGWTRMQRRAVFQTLATLLQNGTVQERQDAALRWGRYEDAVMQAMRGQRTPAPLPALEKWVTKYQLQAHYLSQQCFTSERAVLYSAMWAASVPTVIVHGTHDWICVPRNAELLQRCMPRARMRWVERGTHAASDPLIRNALSEEIGKLADAR